MTETETPGIRPTYSSYTYDSPNGIKRALHRHRYRNILKGLNIDSATRVLDYGAGDGRLFRIMIDELGASPANLIAFDPVPAMRREFAVLVPECSVFGDCEEIKTPKPGEGFDYVFSCEVFEHLSGSQIEFTLAQFVRLAGPQTVFVVEVPIEIGPVGLMKNLYRRFKSGVDISTLVMLKALFGYEQMRKPRVTPSGEETFEHPGFSFVTTGRLLSRIMTISQVFNDPFRRAPFIFNNSRIMVGRMR